MAKVYAAPIDPPAWEEYEDNGRRIDMKKMDEVDTAYIARLAEMARANVRGNGDLVGETIRFQVADGYAVYMVWRQRPLELIHLNLHDGYDIPEAHERGLNLADVRSLVDRSKAWAELFSQKPA